MVGIHQYLVDSTVTRLAENGFELTTEDVKLVDRFFEKIVTEMADELVPADEELVISEEEVIELGGHIYLIDESTLDLIHVGEVSSIVEETANPENEKNNPEVVQESGSIVDDIIKSLEV